MTPATSNTLTPNKPKVSLLRYVFAGDDGLRAGWSLILFLVLTVPREDDHTFLCCFEAARVWRSDSAP